MTHVLQGSVRRGGGQLRVNVRLTDTRSNRIVWARRYDRAFEDVLDMQGAIASEVVARLHRELIPERFVGRDSGTRDAEAYDMFHKGRSLYLRGMNYRSLRAARALLQRSVEIDPGFARGHAQLAICESCLAMNIENRSEENAALHGMAHARGALERVPDLALGHAAEGLAFYAAGRYGEAERALHRAIDLDGRLFEAHFFLGRNRRLQGERERASERFRIAASLRTDDYRSIGLLGEELKAIGRVDESREALAAAVGRVEAELERHPDNADALSFGAPILTELGRTDQALTWCAWALAIEPDDSLLRYNVARVHALSGDVRRIVRAARGRLRRLAGRAATPGAVDAPRSRLLAVGRREPVPALAGARGPRAPLRRRRGVAGDGLPSPAPDSTDGGSDCTFGEPRGEFTAVPDLFPKSVPLLSRSA